MLAAWSQGGVQPVPGRFWPRAGKKGTMSTAAAARPPGGQQHEPEFASAKDEQKARALGLTSQAGQVTGDGAARTFLWSPSAGAGILSRGHRVRITHGRA
jgi:hypothetical protein